MGEGVCDQYPFLGIHCSHMIIKRCRDVNLMRKNKVKRVNYEMVLDDFDGYCINRDNIILRWN